MKRNYRLTPNKQGVSHHFLLPLLAIIAVGGIGYYMLTASNAATLPGDPTGVQAKRAYDFVNSQGVVAHIGEDLYTDKEDVLAALRYTGIGHVRDNLMKNNDVRAYLAQNGIKTTYTLTTPDKKEQPLSTKPTVTDAAVVKRTADLLGNPEGATKYIANATFQEPFNEYDHKATEDPDWATTITRVQQKMWEESKANLKPENKSFKVMGPSLLDFKLASSSVTLQSKNIGQYMDLGNLHSYYGGRTPETNLADNDGLDGFVVPESEIPKKSNVLEERLRYIVHGYPARNVS